jgi:hypothetical protein
MSPIADGHICRSRPSGRSGKSGAVSGRSVAKVVAGAFLVGVAAVVAWGVWSIVSGPDQLDTAPLVEDLNEFSVPSGARSSQLAVTECTGEASFPAYAERPFLVDGTAEEVVSALRSEAAAAGWSKATDAAGVGVFTREDHVLYIDTDYPGGQPTVILHVETSDPCCRHGA